MDPYGPMGLEIIIFGVYVSFKGEYPTLQWLTFFREGDFATPGNTSTRWSIQRAYNRRNIQTFQNIHASHKYPQQLKKTSSFCLHMFFWRKKSTLFRKKKTPEKMHCPFSAKKHIWQKCQQKGGWFFYTSPWRRLLIAATEEAHHANDHTNPQNETTFSSWWLGCPPIPVTVTTRITMFLVGDPYKPSFATFTGRGDNSSWWFQTIWKICSSNWIISPGRGKKEKNIWNHHPVLGMRHTISCCTHLIYSPEDEHGTWKWLLWKGTSSSNPAFLSSYLKYMQIFQKKTTSMVIMAWRVKINWTLRMDLQTILLGFR